MLRDLGILTGSTSVSSSLQLTKGVGFISVTGTFNGAIVAVQYQDSDGAWKAFADADTLSEASQYLIDLGGVEITVRVSTVSGTPTALQISGGTLTDSGQGHR